MKKRITAVALCAMLLMTMLSVAVGAVPSPAIPDGTAPTGATALSYTAYYGTSDGAALSELTAFDADTAAALQQSCGGITTDSSTGLPCQVFEVDASGVTADSIVLTLAASTIENERVALKVFNVTTNVWDTVDTAVTEGNLSAQVALATYAANGKVKAMATVDYISNGSNRLLWSTDQQHYTKFDDLNDTYYGIHEYMVEEYKAGKVAYVINTGDIVDDTPSMSGAKAQWGVANKAFDILDQANVPYGIVTGNHDVGDYPINNYSHYLNYFSEDRYKDDPWFGGTIDDNKCHYDLITAGNVDLLILYIGYGIEDQTSVIDWANDVIAMYPHRNVILATHQYLNPVDLDYGGRADILFNTIVSENDNVMMVLSGHYEGAGYRTLDLDGRIVQEVIADYQFVQKESDEYYADAPDPTHSIGSVPHCNGEGYIREVIIEGNTVSMLAFSPITGGEKPYGQRDEITLEVPFKEAQRRITTYQFAALATDSGDTQLYSWTDANGDTVYALNADSASDATSTVYVDRANLQKLINSAAAITAEGYVAEDYAAMTAALATAKTAVASGTDAEVRAAYTALQNAVGALSKEYDGIDRNALVTVKDLDLSAAAWKNASGTENLLASRSYIEFTQNDNGGFTAEKSFFSNNNWPAMQYIEPITFTPVDGKVYLYLDLEAGSTWSCYPTIIQDLESYSGRLNYIIEGSYGETFDAGGGKYYGVYDITQALVDLGLDMSKEMTISFTMNVVPGPVTVNAISVLTGTPAVASAPTAPSGTTPNSGIELWMIIVLIVVVVIVIGVVAFAILYKPKKKEETPAPEAIEAPAAESDPKETE